MGGAVLEAETVRFCVDQIVRHFQELEDPRSTVNRRHPLVSVVVISIMAVLAGAVTGIDQPVLAIDGKTLRRSDDRANGLGALHSVSVWATDFGLTLGQVATDEKSNALFKFNGARRFPSF